MMPSVFSSTPVVAVSTSDTPKSEMEALGLSKRHFQNAIADIAIQVLSGGWNLAYGGDLRVGGFVSFLLDLLARYGDHPTHSNPVAITDYLAWPSHIRMEAHSLQRFVADHRDVAHFVILDRNGARLSWDSRLSLETQEPSAADWAAGLTRMRTVMRDETHARIVLGGRVKKYRGRMPGVAEEVLLSLQASQPVFLLGGFGGCARDIVEALGLVEPWPGSRGDWTGREDFLDYTPDDLCNGLSRVDNEWLARTPHIQDALMLVSRGLAQVFHSPDNPAQESITDA